MKTKKILFVATDINVMGDSGIPTGWWISEASHPWKILHQAGYSVDFVSPMGGNPARTGTDLKDPVNYEFLENSEIKRKISNMLTPAEINIDNYIAIHYIGGHGAMWDLPYNSEINKITTKMWEQGKIVSAVCHGVCGLLNIKLKSGEYLIKGRDITSYTDNEEKALGMCNVIPYFLQCELMLRGARFHISPNSTDNIQVHERLITGQNPQSAMSVGKALLTMIQKLGL